MDHFARLGSLIAETGPLLDPIEVTEFPEEKAWGIRLDEETFVFVDYQPDDQSVVFSAELGVPAAVKPGRFAAFLDKFQSAKGRQNNSPSDRKEGRPR